MLAGTRSIRESGASMNAHPTGGDVPGNDRVLARALEALAERLDAIPQGLALIDADDRSVRRERLVRDVRASAERARDLDAPLLVVLGGVTGAGKSTVTNNLVGRPVVETGVIRPTTATPTLVVNPGDAQAFRDDRVLPDLPRATSATGHASGEVLLVVEDAAVPAGLALIDAPDIDSVSDANRSLADRLLDAADVWVWFTTVGKYADEDSMAYVRRAATRDTALVIALTQVREGDRDEVVSDLESKLAAAGVSSAAVVVVPWATVTDGLLPASAVVDLEQLLVPLAEPSARRAHRRRTLAGAVATLPAEVGAVAAGIRSDLEAARMLTDEAAAAYARATRDFSDALDEGLPLEAEVLSRWNRFVGGGRLLRMAEDASGQARTWLRSLLDATAGSREERLEREVKVEVADTVGDLAVRVGDLAAADVAEGWARGPAGRTLLSSRPELGRASPDLRDRTTAIVGAWQEHVVELVATRGAERRTRARWVSTLLNAAATTAVVVALAQTGGLTGAEAGIATAAGAANQTLLTKLLGAQNLRWLVTTARADLAERFAGVLADERQRYIRAVADEVTDPEHVDHLERALADVMAARR